MTGILTLTTKLATPCRGLLAALFMTTAVVSGAANTAFAQDKAELMDPKAIKVLDAMSAYLGKAKTLSFVANTSFDDLQTGLKTKVFRTTKIYAKRPAGTYASELTDDGSGRKIWFDGNKLTQYFTHTNKYQELQFKGTNDAVMDELVDKYDARFVLGDLLYTDSAKNFKEYLLSAEYMGLKLVGGTPAHHLSFESEAADFQIWVQVGANPVPLRYEITHVDIPSEPEFLSRFTNWVIDAPANDEVFRAVIPADAKKEELKVNAEMKKK
jgi:hypothetical protein